jgi:YbbR domain-containing protein
MKLSARWLWSLATRNFLWKALALAIAVAIWAAVEVEPEVATSVSVLMEYNGLPDGLEISGLEPANNTVTLEIRGPSRVVRGLGEPGGPRAEVALDLSSARPGISTFMIGNGNVILARGLRMVRAMPSEARFEFEPRATRAVPVIVRFRGEGANGFGVAHYEVTPSELEIAGPASHVQRVASALTDPVDVSNAQGTAAFPVNVYVNDAYVRFHTPPQVVVRVTMGKR